MQVRRGRLGCRSEEQGNRGNGQREGLPAHTCALTADTQAQTQTVKVDFPETICKDWQTQQRIGFQDSIFFSFLYFPFPMLPQHHLSCLQSQYPTLRSYSVPEEDPISFIRQWLLELCYSNMELKSVPLTYTQGWYNPLPWRLGRGAHSLEKLELR